MIELTIEQAKLCVQALLDGPYEHRSPQAALAKLMVEKLQPGTTFYGDPRHNRTPAEIHVGETE